LGHGRPAKVRPDGQHHPDDRAPHDKDVDGRERQIPHPELDRREQEIRHEVDGEGQGDKERQPAPPRGNRSGAKSAGCSPNGPRRFSVRTDGGRLYAQAVRSPTLSTLLPTSKEPDASELFSGLLHGLLEFFPGAVGTLP
jgi:hypothetical protein